MDSGGGKQGPSLTNAQHRKVQAGDPHSPQPELKGTSLFTEQEPKNMYRQVMELVSKQKRPL